MKGDKQDLRLDFGNLPLVEAAVRSTFGAPVPLSYATVNAVGKRLEPMFPALTQPQQIEVAPGAGPSPVEFGPPHLPGAVYTGHKCGLSVSIHPQVIVARWVKQFVPSETDYPRFAVLRDALWDAMEAFRRAVGDDFPGITVVNMTYVNFLPTSNMAAVTSYFAKAARLDLLTDAHVVRKLEAAWGKDESVDVRFALEQVAARFGGSIQDGYRLTTAAGIRLGESLDAKSALERVHATLQSFFLELISDHAKKEWQLKEPPNA